MDATKQPPGTSQKPLRKPDSMGASSHQSLPTLGTLPLGSLQVHRLDGSYGDMDGGEETLQLEEDPTSEGPLSLCRHAMGGGDVVLVLDLPEVFTVGYDCVSFTAKHFGGIRDVPRGPHFLWVAHPNGLSTRCGAWFVATGEHRVHVLQWDKFNEVLGEPTTAEARIQAGDITAVHAKLAPYSDPAAVNTHLQDDAHMLTPKASGETWHQLADSISDRVLDRIVGHSHGEWFLHTADRVRGAALMAAEVELDKHISNPLLQGRELNFAFSQVSKTYTVESRGADRTLDATDATSYMLSLLQDDSLGLSDDDIVGEFQFAYIAGSLLGNDACIQQWWHMLLRIILRAFSLPIHRPSLAAALLRTTAAQLSHSFDYLDTSILEYSEAQSRETAPRPHSPTSVV